MILLNLTIKNFKGIKNLEMDFDGDADIVGKNKAGKTTLFDAMCWLIDDKNRNEKKAFKLKPQDEHGSDIHNLETTVEAVFDAVSLKKIYKEDWVKKRGSTSSEFTGHTTEYYIDDVKKAKTKYYKKVEEFFNIDMFRLLSDPFAFSRLPWQKKREYIIDIVCDISDGDVINSNDKLKPLSDITMSIDDFRDTTKSDMKTVNESLKTIPARIDEQHRNIKVADEIKIDAGLKEKLTKENNTYLEGIQNLKTNEALSKKQIELNELQLEINEGKKRFDVEKYDKIKPLKSQLEEKQHIIEEDKRAIKEYAADIEEYEKRIRLLIGANITLRAKFKKINSEKPDIKTVCPVCDQDLPTDRITQAQEKFLQQKSEKLEEINTRGKRNNKLIEGMEKDIAELKDRIEDLKIDIKDYEIEIESILKKIKNIQDEAIDLSGLAEKESKLIEEIEKLAAGIDKEAIAELENKIAENDEKIKEINESEATIKAAQSSRERIKELELEEKELAVRYNNLEKNLFLIELFIKTKVEMLEGNINQHFSGVQFKMFETQINQGIKDTCIIMVDGVPFDEDLNGAGRVNAGLSIINTIAEYAEFWPPVFIDNAESVSEIIETKGQQIRLYVNPDYEELTLI
jgi:DNA repair exonuclease SbcCD ATPase subunit